MNNDLISRRAALDALDEIESEVADGYGYQYEKWRKYFCGLPSAQPERLTDYSFEESCTECPAYDTENHRCPRFNQVIRTALKDANLEPCENCISRQAVIDALDEQIALCDKTLKSFGISMRDEYAVKVERASLVAFREKLEYLQPAQPETATVTIGRTRGSVTMWYECDACGEPVDQKDNYCRKCGRKLKHE